MGVVQVKILFWQEDWAVGHNFMKIRHCFYIYSDPKS